MKKFKLCIMIVSVVLMFFSSFIVHGYDDSSLENLRSALQRTNTYGTHYFYIQPGTSSNSRYNLNASTSGFKFFCQGDVYVYVTGSTPYGTIAYNLKFDPEILHNIAGNINNGVIDSMPHSAFVPNYDNLYSQRGQSTTPKVGGYIGKFSFTPWTGRTEMWIDICDNQGNNCTPIPNPDKNYDEAYSAIAGGSNNYLEGVKGAIYDLYAWPCDKDVNAPTIINPYTGNVNNQFTGSHYFTGLVADVSNTSWGYWFSGTNPYSETGLNYVTAPSSVDNQGGVNKNTISVKFEYLSGNQRDVTYSISSGNLYTTVWGGGSIKIGSSNKTRNQYTWNSNDRGYIIGFTGTNLEPEKPVRITISASDNGNEIGTVYRGTGTSVIANPVTIPTITAKYNTNGTEWRTDNVFPSMNNEYMVVVEDSPAGIDPTTIQITFGAVDDGSGHSTPSYTLSGSDLRLTVSGSTTFYNGANTKYEVRFNPRYNLVEGGITTPMTVYVEDAVGNSKSRSYNLKTRGACSSFGGCRDYLNINHFGEDGIIRLFSGLNIVVTGDINSIYPYLEGDMLHCGLPFDGADLVPQGVMNLYQHGNGAVQSSLRLTGANRNVREAANSADVDHDFGRDENNRNMIKDISVY